MVKLDFNDVINTICPWSGKPVSEDSLTLYRDKVVGFCNPGCRDKFERARDMFDAAMQTRAKPGDPGQGD